MIGKKAEGLRKLVVDSLSDGISSLCLVQESGELDEALETRITEDLLEGVSVGYRERRDAIRKSNKVKVLSRCGEMKCEVIACVERCVGWANNCQSLRYTHAHFGFAAESADGTSQ